MIYIYIYRYRVTLAGWNFVGRIANNSRIRELIAAVTAKVRNGRLIGINGDRGITVDTSRRLKRHVQVETVTVSLGRFSEGFPSFFSAEITQIVAHQSDEALYRGERETCAQTSLHREMCIALFKV